jgi:hypothetical protein
MYIRLGHRLPGGFFGSVGFPLGRNHGGYSGHSFKGYGYGRDVEGGEPFGAETAGLLAELIVCAGGLILFLILALASKGTLK